MTADPPQNRASPSRALLCVLLLLASLGIGVAGAATGLESSPPVAGGSGLRASPAPPVAAQLSTMTNTTTVTNATNDTVSTVTGTADDATTTVTNATDGTVTTVSNATNDTVAGTVDDVTATVTNETDGPVNGSSNVSAELEVDAGVGADANASGAAAGDDGSGDGSGQDTNAGTTPTATGPAGADSPAPAGPTGSEQRRGGGLPAAAGGAVALGVATLAGAALLHRSPGSTVSSGRAALSALRGSDLGLRDWIRWVLWTAGYSRFDDSDPLAHETRAALYGRIEETPGVYLSALAEALDVPISTARHHLRVLEGESLVTTAVIRGKRRFFPVSTEHPALQAALVDETQADLLAAIARHDRATVSTLAAEIDRDVSTVTYQLQQLAEDDLVARNRDGRRVWNRLAPHVEPYFEGAATGAETD